MNTPNNSPERKGKLFKDLYRTTSDYLREICTRGRDRNVLIVDGLKYRLHGDKLIIDKNAAESADIQGKHYERVIELPLDKSEIKRRLELVEKLVNYGIRREDINVDAFRRHLSQITWTEDLQRKMDLLKGKPYAPDYAHQVILLGKMNESEIIRRINLINEMEKQGMSFEKHLFNFDSFEKGLYFSKPFC